jgi:hypothetical protein
MAKAVSATTVKQSKTERIAEDIIPRPVLNTPDSLGARNASKRNLSAMLVKKRYVLIDQDGKITATLLDQSLAEKWVSDRKKGAVRFISEDSIIPAR